MKSIEDVKQFIVLIVLAISLFSLLYMGQIEIAEKIIIAFVAIVSNGVIVGTNKTKK